ncbi:FAD-dependent monooxygenase [Tolypothrix sp. PCC 7910]|uniref:FAD-dependent oxidoreductase n=1 Tax=Tolypothrix sp. PCC 7910 TaxID=2099387 RepID=UPI0014279124|nr:NAD(P)/FAD-dependent oxidoreductase [Tolypothrix sp. PCC 7910]QIR40755.1 FAD-dependent monooxygenase [Tolypothrix sp. PCC 7910]
MNTPQSQSTAYAADTFINKIYDVVIVGAGPVGLATAIGLRKRGIENILVIDQARAFRQVGQVVDLLPNGLKALKYLEPNAYEAVKTASLTFVNSPQFDKEQTTEVSEKNLPKPSQQWVSKNLQGKLVRATSLSFDVWLQNYGEGRISISWYDLQTTLRKLLPEDQVKPNHRCINVVDEPEMGCVRLDCLSDTSVEANPYAYWADGQKNNDLLAQNLDSVYQNSVTKSFRAKIAVAADGINSTVRRLLYADSPYQSFAKPEYSGYAAIYCREITDIPKELRSRLEEKFFAGSPILTVANYDLASQHSFSECPRMMLVNRESILYLLHLPVPLNSLQDKSGNELINLALQELEKADYPDELKQLVQLSPPENMSQRPYYIHRATACKNIFPGWSAGRIILVGDAAHGMPPFMAQGANQGLEDAMVVTTLINNIAKENDWDNKQAIATAFEKYERLRRPFMEYIQAATLTHFPSSSDQQWQEYNQKVYTRNFDQIITELQPISHK